MIMRLSLSCNRGRPHPKEAGPNISTLARHVRRERFAPIRDGLPTRFFGTGLAVDFPGRRESPSVLNRLRGDLIT